MRWSSPWLVLFALSAAESGVEEQPSPDKLEETMRVLSGEVPLEGQPLRSRNIHHPDHPRARAWLRSRLEGIEGLVVWEEPFEAEGRAGLGNLIAELPGAQPDRPMILVGAHLDSTASRTDGWDPTVDEAPGADDDASGVAAVLEIARLLAPETLASTVRFVLFDAEEEGLIGSEIHAAAYDAGEIALMLSLDPIGHNPGGAGYLWISFDPRWPSAAEAVVSSGERLQTPLVMQPVDGSLLGANSQRSDHAPFWSAGHPALHLASFPQPPDYHQVTDTLDVVDVAFTASVAALVRAHVRDLAEPMPDVSPRASTPERGGCGG